MSLLANSNAIETGGYQIQRSLRFRSSASAYLNRTPASASNRKTWTWSGWVKRGALGTYQNIFEASDGSGNNEAQLSFSGSDTIIFYSYIGAYQLQLQTAQVFRDPSSWYHIVVALDTTQATASNRAKLYVNGVQVTAFVTATYPSQNYDAYINTTQVHTFGRNLAGLFRYFDGYLAEVNFIDGQALTPSSFGQTDPVTGVWQPKKYTGTYGTNGFYLDFKDNTSATTLAYDKSGNGNNWTPNNISTTAGATYDSMTDVPTLTSATSANFCVLNPLDKGSSVTISNGNLTLTGGSAAWASCKSTFGVTSGKWYWEVTATNNPGVVGIALASANNNNFVGSDAYGWGYDYNGNKKNNGTSVAYGSTWTTNDVIGIAFDSDAGTLVFYKNNTSQGTAFTGLTSGPYFPMTSVGNTGDILNVNHGQRPFSYTPPTGFKALNTFNLPDPTIKKPNQYMDATLYTGTGSALSVTNAGAFQPDFVWLKGRSTAYGHQLFDSLRGATNYLVSNTTDAEGTNNQTLTSFNSNGFSVGTNIGVNQSTAAQVGWQWKESATAGFDIVTYTFASTGIATINHSLGVAPKMIIAKRRDTTEQWLVYHSAGTTQSQYLGLNTTAAVATSANLWGSSAFTSSQFYFNATSGYQYVFYIFAEIPGFSKFGSYTGNGSADGPFVYCGFRPKYVMIKRTDAANDWIVMDTQRLGYNQTNTYLEPNTSDAESTDSGSGSRSLDIVSNGFKNRDTSGAMNANGGTYIFAAFAENPFKYSNAR